MKLSSLRQYNKIVIQCHDNPDADAIASGFVLLTYFKSCGGDARLIYSGNREITKTNLKMMISELDIPIEFVSKGAPLFSDNEKGILITTDCQYGAGNVTMLDAPNVAVIDHHHVEIESRYELDIRPECGSCCTVVWSMLMDEGVEPSLLGEHIATALYYGLFSDTNQFSEMSSVDRDMYDYLLALTENKVDTHLISMMKNSNISLEEMDIAGIALLRRIINAEHHYALVHANYCDPNILGLISDFLLQVDGINICLVYNEIDGGLKLSVRSCTKEVEASELAAFLTMDIGSGGGHREKAGGYISLKKYNEKYLTLHTEAYFSRYMNKYFDETEIIYASKNSVDISELNLYTQKDVLGGFVEPSEFVDEGTGFVVRTIDGDIEGVASKDSYLMIGIEGEIFAISRDRFNQNYRKTDDKYVYSGRYNPTLREQKSNKVHSLLSYVKGCKNVSNVQVYAKKLIGRTKVFTLWNTTRYQLGVEGDYICVSKENPQDIFIISKKIFEKNYNLNKLGATI